MTDAIVHDFQERLEWSATLSDEGDWVAFYRRIWPDMIATIRVDKDSRWQRDGVDRIVILPHRKQLLIDEKKRQKDYGDVLLEKWSVWHGTGDPRNKVGWALDKTKVCDYVVYAVPTGHTAYLLPFELLRMACEAEGAAWDTVGRYNPSPAQNRGYVTCNWAIPWGVLKHALNRQMYRQFAATPVALPVPRDHAPQLLFPWPTT